MDVATKNPAWVADTDTALSAINTMNKNSITSLLVTKKSEIKKKIKKLLGVIHLHTALTRGIK
jgi:CBS domain-containing protein